MENMKPCPFCGSIPMIVEKHTIVRLNSGNTTAQNMVLIEKPKDNRSRCYKFRQTKYNLLCPKTNCPAHSASFLGFTKEDLIERWNKRSNDEEEGRWLEDNLEYTCAECGYKMSKYISVSKKYCPDCGHKMKRR